MLNEKNMLNNKLWQGPSVAMTAPGVPQPPVDDDKMDGLQERLLKEIGKIHKYQHTIHCPPNHPNTFDSKEGGAKA